MNARRQEYCLSLESRQIEDAVSCIFHSLLLHRTLAKFTYTGEKNYKLGSLGVLEQDCDYIDLSYVRVNSPTLAERVAHDVHAFSNKVASAVGAIADYELQQQQISPCSSPRSPPHLGRGAPKSLLTAEIRLEFYQRRRRPWPMGYEQTEWEVWALKLDVTRAHTDDELERLREPAAESVADVLLSSCAQLNRPQYVPKMPTRSQLDDVFDSALPDCQPYLFRMSSPFLDGGHLSHGTGGGGSSSSFLASSPPSTTSALPASPSSAVISSLSAFGKLMRNTLAH